MTEKKSPGHVHIRSDFQSISIEIPVQTKWFIIVLLLVFLGKILHTVFSKSLKYNMEEMFYDMEYAIYLLWGAMMIFTLGSILTILWLLFGKETIQLEKGILKIKKSLFGIGNQKRYEIAKIKNLGLNLEQQTNNNTTGKIVFNYQGKSIQFAGNVDEAEAKEILKITHYDYSE